MADLYYSNIELNTMKIYKLRLTLLNHLFYFTEMTNGSRTGNFIGDLALTYAFRPYLAPANKPIPFRDKPEYEEIKDWGYYCTMAMPERSQPTNVYTKNTLFNTDGFFDTKSLEDTAKSPFKNLVHVQGVEAQSTFLCYLVSKNDLDIPPTIRVGNGRETLVAVEEIETSEQGDLWLNAYTHKIVFDNLEEVADLMAEEQIHDREYVLENYILLKGFKKKHLPTIFNQTFN
ncbi:type I-D CRISPR-associated protein Cas5/Csc1 [Aureibacter tunicatorum]|uniref:CRISPR-associated protein Csc1 n=1 Tax=Aureibacter tunicatorum TaxID=866807 RepID=A0AAE3XQ27_9BACT|nr:type I-D CRISPR-associated protein Cas5/Csc1 [Aureibacter tunicatorum]MDR6241941.1 CRISPR-associated protein Csc1 [Aureibacter tunicatorum]BDD07547.1 hypothetical protein AUTU_50300 [Aureibacter tunicatorum]